MAEIVFFSIDNTIASCRTIDFRAIGMSAVGRPGAVCIFHSVGMCGAICMLRRWRSLDDNCSIASTKTCIWVSEIENASQTSDVRSHRNSSQGRASRRPGAKESQCAPPAFLD